MVRESGPAVSQEVPAVTRTYRWARHFKSAGLDWGTSPLPKRQGGKCGRLADACKFHPFSVKVRCTQGTYASQCFWISALGEANPPNALSPLGLHRPPPAGSTGKEGSAICISLDSLMRTNWFWKHSVVGSLYEHRALRPVKTFGAHICIHCT